MAPIKQRGFTIIELTLYLGVAGLLLASMMVGITVSVKRQRFADSVNATQGFLQQQFNETQNTLNDRVAQVCDNATPGSGGIETQTRGASKCLIAGKLLDIRPTPAGSEGTIAVHNVLIKADLPADYATLPGGDVELFQNQLNTTVVENALNDTTFRVPWGAELPQLRYGSTPLASSDIRYIALLRSPVSGSIGLYYMVSTADLSTPSQVIGDSDLRPFAPNEAARVCINSVDISTAKALLKISPVSSQDSVTTHFDDDVEKNNWCP